MAELRGKDRRALRALGHHLRPVVQIGHQGVTPAVVEATSRALDDHELVKVKVLESAPEDRFETARSLAEATSSELVQVLGRTILLYRPSEEGESAPRPPKAAPHGHVGGEGDRPAAGARKRAIPQGARRPARGKSSR
mgnify:CR=1 FL=1